MTNSRARTSATAEENRAERAPEPAETSRTKSAEAAKNEKSAPRTAERPAERVVRFSSEKPATGDDDRVKELYEELTEARKSGRRGPGAVRACRGARQSAGAEVRRRNEAMSPSSGITKDGKVSLTVEAEKKTDK